MPQSNPSNGLISFGLFLRAGVFALLASCIPLKGPPEPESDLLGCLSLSGDVLDSVSDSLGYRVPNVIKLTSEWNGAGKPESWMVLPFGHPKPSWTYLDWLPSSSRKRWETRSDLDPIPGDSFDVYFPCDHPCRLGDAVLRLGADGTSFGGRVEWIHLGTPHSVWAGMTVRATPTSCSALPEGLEHLRKPDFF
jgi:hypothetical protein